MKLVNLFLSFPVSAQFRIESKGEYLTFLFLNSILYVRSREIFVWCWSWFHKNTPSWRAAGRIQKRGRVFWSFRKMEKTTNFVEWFFYIFGYFGFPFIDFENLAKSELFFWLHVFKWFDGRTLEMKFECFDFWFKKWLPLQDDLKDYLWSSSLKSGNWSWSRSECSRAIHKRSLDCWNFLTTDSTGMQLCTCSNTTRYTVHGDLTAPKEKQHFL